MDQPFHVFECGCSSAQEGNLVENRYNLGELNRDNPNQVKDYYDLIRNGLFCNTKVADGTAIIYDVRMQLIR